MWAPDAAEKNGKYYLYFPAKDKQDVFRIGVGGCRQSGRTVQGRSPKPIKGSFSIDPAVFKDTDGKYYMYFGGIWGGQLQRWASGSYKADDAQPREGSAGAVSEGRAVGRRHGQLRREPERCRASR